MATVTSHPEIALDDRGVAWIRGTSAKVPELVAYHLAHGWDAKELADQLPHLSLARTRAALRYYQDHRDQIDRELAEDDAFAKAARAESNQSAMVEEWLRRVAARE